MALDGTFVTQAAIRSERLQAEAELVRLMDDYERPLFHYVRNLLHDPQRAEDCCQETFLQAYQQLVRQRPVTAGWLYKVARCRAIDVMRGGKRLVQGETVLEHWAIEDDTETSVAVRETMAQLPPPEQELLYLFVIAGVSTVEIGQAMGIRASAVRQRLYRARERFRQLYSAG